MAHLSRWSAQIAFAALIIAAPAFAEETYQLDIPPQPVGQALQRFAEQSGLQVVYYANVAQGRNANRVVGTLSADEALKQLLEDTGLAFDTVDARTVAIRSAKQHQKVTEEKTSAVRGEGQERTLVLAQAQTEGATNTEPASVDNKDTPALEEIVVTAERRQERSQEVPISMSVYSRDFIKQYISDPYEVAKFTPNYQISASDGLSNSKATIRGLGGDQGGALIPVSVLNYYDGLAADVPFIASLPQWDLDRIEVQRGPQGTLYGRNAVGGAIQYISAAPTEEFEGYGELTLGEFDLRRFEGAVSGPITANVKARLSALTYDRSGDVANTFHNTKAGAKDWWGVKGIIDWQISENFNTQVKARHFEGGAGVIRFNAAPGNLLSPNFQAWLDAIGNDPDMSRASNFERYQSGLEPSESMNFDIVEMDFNYDFGPAALTAIGGYIDGKSLIRNSIVTLPVQAADDLVFFDTTQWSGEARLTSQTDHPLQWIAGAYYQHSESSQVIAEDLSALLRDLDGDGLTRHNANSPEDQLDGIIPAFAGISNVFSEGLEEDELETYASFVHTTYDWTDRFTTTHALRYTHEARRRGNRFGSIFEFPVSFGVTPGTLAEHNDFVRFANLNPAQQRQQAVSIFSDPNTLDANGNVVIFSARDSWQALTWRLAADYRLTDEALVYASISEGFKGGIFSGAGSPAEVISADPETSIVYEVGAKSQWFDNRLQVNASAFYNDHRDYQTRLIFISGSGQLSTRLENLPKSEIYGGEIEIQAVPFRNLLVVANLGILQAEMTEAPPGNEALIGNKLPNVEDMNFSGVVRYDVPTALGTFSPQLSWRYRGEYWSSKENDDLTGPLGNFWTADIRLGYESSDGKLYGMFYWKNIFDEVQPIFTALPLAVLGTSISTINERRNWGVAVGYRF